MAPELPPDVLEKILLIGFDIKNLTRLKSVCKSWHSFVSSPRFVNAHLNHNITNDRINNRRIVKPLYPTCYVRHYCEVDHEYYVTGSFNGLVCISTFQGEVLVANPSIGETRKLQKPVLQDGNIMSLCWGFGYDSSTYDYKVIVGLTDGQKTCFRALSLKSNVWKAIGEVKYNFVSRVGTLCNGVLYWFMNDQDNKKVVILSFNISKEEFKEIPQPNDKLYQHCIEYRTLDLCVIMEESLCICHGYGYNYLWMMKYTNYANEYWEFMSYDNNMKYEVVHLLEEVKQDIPCKRFSCRSIKSDEQSTYVTAPIFVESLVSPHLWPQE